MSHPGRQVQDLPFLDGNLAASDLTSKCALQHINHLLAFVTVERDVRAAQEMHLDHHLTVTDKHLARHHLGYPLKRHLIPPFNAPCLHVAYVSANETPTGGCQTELRPSGRVGFRLPPQRLGHPMPMSRFTLHVAGLSAATMVSCLCLVSAQSAGRVKVLRSTAGLPPHVVGLFRQPVAFQQSVAGDYYVLDRGGHTIYRVTPQGDAEPIVRIGPEQGHLLGAVSFHLRADGQFAVADAPNGRERVQIFDADGTRVGGFTLPGRAAPRITLGNIVLNGVGSLQFTERSIVLNQPELGGLVTEFSLSGDPFRTFGAFRPTGFEDDRNVNLALNSGIPLVNPSGGYYFVFQAGVPMFRRYDALGHLLFERHIEGPEVDPIIATLPTTWPRRTDDRGRDLPVVPPTVRTASVDRSGNLWVVLTAQVIYVFDPSGEKIRTVTLEAAGIIQPDSLSFSNTNSLLVTPGCYEYTVW